MPIYTDHPIVGTWKLLSFTNADTATGAVIHPLGEKPNAIVIYSADGYAATIFTSAHRIVPIAAQASDEEPKIRFAPDSPLEERRFEPVVPLARFSCHPRFSSISLRIL
jgi:hypothetical protein